MRRRREEQQVEIRRQKREESVAKRRNFNISTGPDSDDESVAAEIDTKVSVACYYIGLYLLIGFLFSSLKNYLL